MPPPTEKQVQEIAQFWVDARRASAQLRPAEEWRTALAERIRRATGARFAGVLSCPPGRVLEARGGVDPAEFTHSVDRLVLRFLPRIERGGEGWEAMKQLGTHPYLPLERAQDVELARKVREEILAPLGVTTIVNAFMVAPGDLLLGWIVVGDACEPDALLTRCLPLGELCTGAARTLVGALELAAACGGGLPPPRDPGLESLTDREGQVLRLLGAGLTDGEIAERLGISEQTVGSHLRKVYQKLKVHSRAGAVSRLR